MRRFRISAWLLLAVWFTAGPVVGAEIPLASDLKADAERAARQGAAILVFFAADSCPYCHQVEDLYIHPLAAGRDYGDRLLVRVVRTERPLALTDFAGRTTDHQRFARNERATFTPLVRLYGAGGRELTDPLIGYMPDFYSGLLAQAIENAIARLPAAARVGGD